MKKLNRLLLCGANILFVLIFVFVGIQESNAQNADDFCNCPEGAFPTRVPPQAIKNGAILASDLFRFLRLPNRPPVVKRCLIIDKPLIFNEPWVRTMLHCHLSMEPGSAIYILPSSGGLHYRGGSIRGCSAPWNGISTAPGANLNLEATIISGASTAVSIADSVQMNLRGTTLEDNYFGVEVAEGATLMGNPIFGCNFNNCTLGINNKGNLIVGAESSPNSFDGCTTGILSTNGNLFLSNSSFKNCNTAIVTNNNESVEIVGIQFDSCRSGVRDINSNINIEKNKFNHIEADAINLSGHVMRSIEIKENHINARDGIEAANIFSDNLIIANNQLTPSGPIISGITLSNLTTKDGKVESNTISNDVQIINSDGIVIATSSGLKVSHNTINTNTIASVGMEIVGCSQMEVSENTIYGGPTHTGILVENSQIDLQCNQLYDHLNGIVIKGFSKSDIATNEIHGGTIGLLFEETGIAGPQINTGNLWSGNFNAAGAFHYNFDKSFFSLSNFFINDATEDAFPEKVYPSQWFEKRRGSTRTCGTGGKMTQETLDQEFNQQLLASEIYSDADNRALNFEATRFLFETDIASKAKTDLLTKIENQNIKPLNEVKKGLNNLIDYDAPAMMNYKNQQNELVVTLEELRLLKNHSAETTFDSNEEQSDLNIKLNALLQKIKNQRAELLLALINRASQLQKTLGVVDASEVHESNEVFIQNLHLKILKEGIDAVSNEQKERVEIIAAGNPNIDGMSVYKAKGLLYDVPEFETPSTIETLFTPEIKDIKNVATPDLELEIFPNPTSEFLNIRTLLTNDAFEICNLTGQLMKSGKLNSNSIKISDMPEGFYILRVLDNNQLVATEKFSVIK